MLNNVFSAKNRLQVVSSMFHEFVVTITDTDRNFNIRVIGQNACPFRAFCLALMQHSYFRIEANKTNLKQFSLNN